MTMITRRITCALFSKQQRNNTLSIPQRNVQVSVIGAASDIGSNLVLLLKQNFKIRRLQLYDNDERVKGIGLELGHLPGGPLVSAYAGDNSLGAAIRSSDLIVMVARLPRKPGNSREQMLAANAPAVLKLCRAIADQNPDAFFAISTNPLNAMVPFASSLLFKYNCYNPFKLFGITHIDTARSRAFAGNALQVNPRHLQVPVIGGHSDETIVPLFSNLTPTYYCVDPCQADTLTRLVRKAGQEVVNHKQGTESATLAMAWSVNEFVDGCVDAILGSEVTLSCYTANPHFGTRFFAGPTNVGAYGIIQTCCDFAMSEYECFLLNCTIPVINKEITQGEDYVNTMENVGKI